MAVRKTLLDKLKETHDEMEAVKPTTGISLTNTGMLEAIPDLLSTLRLGTPSQRHDAAKAIGYIFKIGQVSEARRVEAKNVLIDVLSNEYPTMTNAFAMLEALERVDTDAFWTLIMGWYGSHVKSIANTLKHMGNS